MRFPRKTKYYEKEKKTIYLKIVPSKKIEKMKPNYDEKDHLHKGREKKQK